MKPSEIISLARRQTGCTEDIVTTDEAFRFLNFVIEDFGADIRNSDSGYGFDIESINVVAGQSTYTFTNTEGDLSGKFPLHKIQAVWLYDNNNKKWRDMPVHFVDKVDLNKRESVKEPLACFITRESVNLIPTPKESTEMQIWGFNYNAELTPSDDTEGDIWIPARWHYILVEGMKYWLYGNMGVNFETPRVNCRNFYDSEKDKALQNIMDRGQLADTAYLPNLNFLNY